MSKWTSEREDGAFTGSSAHCQQRGEVSEGEMKAFAAFSSCLTILVTWSAKHESSTMPRPSSVFLPALINLKQKMPWTKSLMFIYGINIALLTQASALTGARKPGPSIGKLVAVWYLWTNPVTKRFQCSTWTPRPKDFVLQKRRLPQEPQPKSWAFQISF